MTMPERPNMYGLHEQRGAALVVSLIMLILVSLMGAAGYLLSTSEARGAAGWSDRQRAMFAAEGAIKEAEAAIADIANKPDVRLAVDNKGAGYFLRHEETVPDVSDSAIWTTTNAVKASAADTRVTDVYFMVVYEGTAPKVGSAFLQGNGNANQTAVRPRFTVYAKAGGLKEGTLVVLSASREF